MHEPPPADPGGPSREQLIESHVIHTYDRALVLQNLRGCYGVLTARFYRQVLATLRGRRVLDCGCGFGLFSALAREAGLDVVSIDLDEASLAIAREVFGLEARRESVYETSLPAGSRDVAVFFDSIEHMDLARVGPELLRLGVREVVIYESNERNPLLRWYRRAAHHEEAHEYSAEDVVRAFAAQGWTLRSRRHLNFLALPVSGGFLRPALPLLSRFPSLIAAADAALEPLLRWSGADALLSFRYLLRLERDSSTSGVRSLTR